MEKALRKFLRENLVRTCNGLQFTAKAEEKLQANLPMLKLMLYDDPGLIRFFNKRFLLNNLEIVEAVIHYCLVDPMEYSLAKETLALIPEDILIKFKSLIIKKLEENPMLLDYIPENLQVNFLQIPYEVVKACPMALEFVPVKAMEIFPDIAIEACKRNKDAYDFVPWSFVERYPAIREYSPYHKKS